MSGIEIFVHELGLTLADVDRVRLENVTQREKQQDRSRRLWLGQALSARLRRWTPQTRHSPRNRQWQVDYETVTMGDLRTWLSDDSVDHFMHPQVRAILELFAFGKSAAEAGRALGTSATYARVKFAGAVRVCRLRDRRFAGGDVLSV